jgi:hypothetical protein
MDNFTLAVLIGGAVVFVLFAVFLVVDKKEEQKHPVGGGPMKAGGKKHA